MEHLINLSFNIISEVIGILIISGYVLYHKKLDSKRLKELEQELDLERLNNNRLDEVLLIEDVDYLKSDVGMEAFNRASVVLLKDKTKMYNTVLKNSYGDSGIIGNN